MNDQQLFDSMHPGFFRKAGIIGTPETRIFTGLVMDLRKNKPEEIPFACPEEISFRECRRKSLHSRRLSVYTHLEHWYQKLGYQTILKWNCK